jgi:hypothetical protein
MLSIEDGQKHGEEKGGVTQISPEISGSWGEKGTREENWARTYSGKPGLGQACRHRERDR